MWCVLWTLPQSGCSEVWFVLLGAQQRQTASVPLAVPPFELE